MLLRILIKDILRFGVVFGFFASAIVVVAANAAFSLTMWLFVGSPSELDIGLSLTIVLIVWAVWVLFVTVVGVLGYLDEKRPINYWRD